MSNPWTLPPRKGDWIGWILEATSAVKSGYMEMPAGSRWEIYGVGHGDAYLRSLRVCSNCGIRVRVTVRCLAGSPISGFRVVGDGSVLVDDAIQTSLEKGAEA